MFYKTTLVLSLCYLLVIVEGSNSNSGTNSSVNFFDGFPEVQDWLQTILGGIGSGLVLEKNEKNETVINLKLDLSGNEEDENESRDLEDDDDLSGMYI